MDQTASGVIGVRAGAVFGAGSRRPIRLIKGIASALVIGGFAIRLHLAPLPPHVIRSEQVLLVAGVLYTIAAIAVRTSRWSGSLSVQAAVMVANTVLAGTILALAAPYLPDFLPVAALVFGAVLFNFDRGFESGRFLALTAIPLAGMASLWAYYVAVPYGSLAQVGMWTALLAGVSLLVYATLRILVDRSRAAGSRYEALLESISDMGEALLVTHRGRLVACNQAYLDMTGYSLAELQGFNSLIELSPAEDREHLAEQLRHRLGGDRVPVHYEASLIRKDGRRVEVENSVRVLGESDGARLLAVVRDITERKRTDAALREGEQRVRAVLESVGEGILTISADGIIESANPAIRRLFGYAPGELMGRPVEDLIAPEEATAFTAYFETRARQAALRPSSGLHESLGRRRDGSAFPIDLLINDMHLSSGRMYVVSIRDISERRAHMDALEYQALHDSLTGLPNRTLFQDRLNHAIQTAPRTGRPFAVLLLDLDHFKDVNDVLGHDTGDLLLGQAADRIRRACRGADTVARLGGDEFAVLTGLSQGELDPVALGRKVIEALDDPFRVREQDVKIGASIGVALFPEHGMEARALIRRADVAMYAAKRDGAGITVYHPEHEQSASRRLLLTSELRRALADGELTLEYQPVIDLVTGRATQVEALVRWAHPHEGRLSPSAFIPLAEESGMIGQLTQWVVAAALEHVSRWREQGRDIGISVNISARDLRQEDFPEKVADLLKLHEVPSKSLTLEVTESHLLSADASAHARKLLDLGVGLAVDDFGIGYSSLSSLRQLPVTQLKIDRSFVSTLNEQPDSGAIVKSAVELGHALGMKVIAEGVEDADARRRLVELGCDGAQGFLIGEPMEDVEIKAWLDRSEAAAAS